MRVVADGEVTLSKDDPLSVDLSMFSEKPTTTTNTPEPKEDESSEEETVKEEILRELLKFNFALVTVIVTRIDGGGSYLKEMLGQTII